MDLLPLISLKMSRNFKFRPSLAATRRANLAAMEAMAHPDMSESGKQHLAELRASVKPKQVRGPRKPSAKPTEHQEQAALVSWWYRYSSTVKLDHRLLVAIPNAQMLIGFTRNPGAFMGYLQQEGFRKGAQDLVLFVARGRYHGLLIEMKRTGSGVVSPEQKDMARVIGEQGYMSMVCYGFEDARVTVVKYLEGGE